ncbi:hypothetical protein [Algoriphagus namhaensis]
MRKIKQFLWDYIITTLSLFGIIIIVLIFLFPFILPESKEFEAIIALLILYFGILYNILTYKISADRFSKELFNEFNKRFDEKNEILNKIIAGNTFRDQDILQIEQVVDYLNLCSEEYYWYKKGRIDELVWQSWKKGMMFYLGNANFKRVIEDQRKEKDSYYGLYEELGL